MNPHIVIPCSSEKEPFLQQKKRMFLKKEKRKVKIFSKLFFSSFSALFLSLHFYTIFLSLDYSAFEKEALSSRSLSVSLYSRIFSTEERERE